MERGYIELNLDRPVYKFLRRLFLANSKVQDFTRASPIMTTLEETRFTLAHVCDKLNHERMPDFPKKAIDLLMN